MNNTLKNTLTVILFIGMLFSCFQFTIIQFAKIKKEMLSSFSSEEDEVNDNDDNSEEDTEVSKKEFEETYITLVFHHSSYGLQKVQSAFKEFKKEKLKYPELSIQTPPPKV